MKRRDVLTAAGAMALTGCAAEVSECQSSGGGGERFNWKMVTSWPPNLPGLGTGAMKLAILGHAADPETKLDALARFAAAWPRMANSP